MIQISGSKRLLRKLPPVASPSKERRPVVHARQEPSHHMADSEYPRNRRQELMKCELSERHGRMERISLFMSSQNRRNSLQARTGSPLLYSKKTYVPYPSPWRREETATKLLKRSSGISGVIIKRSYQIKAQSLDNGAKKNRKINRVNSVHKTEYNKADSDIVRRKSAMLPPINNTTLPKADERKVLDEEEYIKVEILNENVQFSKGKTKHEGISKKKLRWILTTEQFQTGGVKANSVEHKDLNDPKAVTGN